MVAPGMTAPALLPWLALLALAACGSSSSGRGATPQATRTPRDEARYAAAVKRHEIKIGMSRAEVLRAWGKPGRKKSKLRLGRKVEVWLYAFSDLYFDDEGYVIGFQSAGG